jgi:hypothetical protein
MRRLAIGIACCGVMGALVVLVCSCGPTVKGAVTAEGKYDLRYGLAKGSRFVLRLSKTHNFSQEVMGNEVSGVSKNYVEYDFEVRSSGKDGLGLELTYKERTYTINAPQSAGDTDFSSLLGKSAGFKISSTGELSGFTGFEALPEVEIAAEQTAMTAERYVNEIRDVFPFLADHPVGVGEGWSAAYVYSEPIQGGRISVNIDADYTLLEETTRKGGEECVKIANDFTFTIEGEGEAQGIKFTVGMSGEGTETLYFAHEKGMLLGVEGSSTATGSADNEELGFRIPMTHTYETTAEIEFL